MENKKYSVVVNAVIANKEKKILLIQRGLDEDHGAGTWSIPGGKLEFKGVVHQALEKTAIKEVLEEVGMEVESEMKLIANNTFQHNEDGLLVIAIVFLCSYKSGEPIPSKEAMAAKWISQEEINNFAFHNINVKNYVLQGFESLTELIQVCQK